MKKRYVVRMPIHGIDLLCGHANTMAEARRIVFKEKYEQARWAADLLENGLVRDGYAHPDLSFEATYERVTREK